MIFVNWQVAVTGFQFPVTGHHLQDVRRIVNSYEIKSRQPATGNWQPATIAQNQHTYTESLSPSP
jgi:hypothetical protein